MLSRLIAILFRRDGEWYSCCVLTDDGAPQMRRWTGVDWEYRLATDTELDDEFISRQV